VGGFQCRCGFLWTLKAETTYGGHLLPNEVVFEEYGEAPSQLLEFAAQQSQVLRCPNCRAVVLEDETGIHFFVAATEPPRLYVDRSDPDALGGFGLQSPRTRSEAADQHLILKPALTIMAYDDTGWSAGAHVESWVDENDNLDPDRLVARVGER
jgi:hypothetical protein